MPAGSLIERLPASVLRERLYQSSVQLALFLRHISQDCQRPLHGHSRLIGPVVGGQRVKNIQYRQNTDLYRDIFARQVLRITCAIQKLMVAGRPILDMGQLRGELNLSEQPIRHDNVRLHGIPLLVRQRPPADGQHGILARRQPELSLPIPIKIRLSG